MRGKYSPTVSAAYQANQRWWDQYAGNNDQTWRQYDPEGYDSYGYNADDCDRAGNYEHEYYPDDVTDDWGSDNYKYNRASDAWGYDGIRPINRFQPNKPVGPEAERLKDYIRYLRLQGYDDAADALGTEYL
jgi:hypothetical protein